MDKRKTAAAAMLIGMSMLTACGGVGIEASAETVGVAYEAESQKEAGPGVTETGETGAPEETRQDATQESLAEIGNEAAAESASASAEMTETAAAASAYENRDETVYVTKNGVNVRTSPEVDNSSDGGRGNRAFLAKAGDSFRRTAYSEGYSKVERDGKEYYISSEYLSLTAPTEEELALLNQPAGSAKDQNGGSAAYQNGQEIGLDPSWKYADFSAIHTGKAVLYKAEQNRKEKIIAVNAGHGTKGGSAVKTYCHPDKTPKLTGGSTKAGATKATAVSEGMTFKDGTPEKTVTLRMAQILKEKLLSAGYDVLMLRDGEDVQLDNIARTVIANNVADCHIALHWDGDGLSTIKGCFYMSVPDGLKTMEPVASHWQSHEALGDALIEGLSAKGMKIWGSNPLDTDLTQTSFSTVPSVDIELGNQCSAHDDGILNEEAEGLLLGINSFFGF